MSNENSHTNEEVLREALLRIARLIQPGMPNWRIANALDLAVSIAKQAIRETQ